MYYSLQKQRHAKRRNEAETLIKDFSTESTEVSNLNKSLDRVQPVLCHIKSIIAEKIKLKKRLRDIVLNDVWRILLLNKECDKLAVVFRTLSPELIKNVNSFITALDKGKEFSWDGLKILHKRLGEFRQVAIDTMDSLEELKNL